MAFLNNKWLYFHSSMAFADTFDLINCSLFSRPPERPSLGHPIFGQDAFLLDGLLFCFLYDTLT